MQQAIGDLNTWQSRAGEVSSLLKSMGNERRLLILCQLAANGEMSVGALVDAADLSQSALSQHLAKMREEGAVAARRDGQTIWYRIADERIKDLMATIYQLYCEAKP